MVNLWMSWMSIQAKKNENITKTQKKQQPKELLNIKHFNFRGGQFLHLASQGGCLVLLPPS